MRHSISPSLRTLLIVNTDMFLHCKFSELPYTAMPAFENLPSFEDERVQETPLQFPPVSKEHILHCSYDFWFPKYRTSCIRSRIIPLTPDFVQYIREDRVILADDDEPNTGEDDDDDWEPTSTAYARPDIEEEGSTRTKRTMSWVCRQTSASPNYTSK